MFSLGGAFALGPPAEEFFKPGPEVPKDKLADQVFPIGTAFPMSFFSVGGGSEKEVNALLSEEEVQKEFARYKDTGLLIFGPQYELNERALKDARQHGMKVIFTVGLPVNFHKEVVEIDPDKVYAEVKRQVEEVMKEPEVAFWYLRPEELRPWRKNEKAYLEAASKAIRETDPLKRPLWIYDPAHCDAKRLASIAPWVDYLGKGLYPNYASMKDARAWCRWSMEQQAEAIRMTGSKAVSLAVPEMFQQPEASEIKWIPRWARHDVYASLVSGAKGVIVFSARRRPNFEAREFYYQAYAQIAKELVGKDGLGKVFLFGEPRSDIQVDIVEGPDEVKFTFAAGGVKERVTYSSVSHLNVAFGKERYLFLVNSSNEPVKLAVGGMPYNAVRAENLFEQAQAFDVGEGEFQAKLGPLEVKAYRFTRR